MGCGQERKSWRGWSLGSGASDDSFLALLPTINASAGRVRLVNGARSDQNNKRGARSNAAMTRRRSATKPCGRAVGGGEEVGRGESREKR